MTVTFRLAALETALAGLFPAGTAVAVVPVRDGVGPEFPAEAAAVAGSVPRRVAEFAAGRAAARRAMAALGLAPAPIPMGADRAPVWPEGLAGSISHAAGVAVAALRRGGGLGLDVEEDAALEPALWPLICTPAELAAAPMADRGRHVRRVFAAKEAVYKAQYAVSRRLIGFDAVEVRFDATGFRARFTRHEAPFAAGDELCGRLVCAEGLILAGVAV
jgi:4'-phosphopantetheinyl transferase EntD